MCSQVRMSLKVHHIIAQKHCGSHLGLVILVRVPSAQKVRARPWEIKANYSTEKIGFENRSVAPSRKPT